MEVSVILGHPYPHSFNHAIAARVLASLTAAGHRVRFHDLYAEGFAPVLTGDELRTDDTHTDVLVDQHCRELKSADGIVVIHPNWWGMPPAILKGWLDRVLRPGVAYRFADDDDGAGVPDGLLHARAAVVFTTSNTPAQRERQLFGDPLETIWRNCVFGFCGVAEVTRRNFGVIAGSSDQQRARWLDEAATTVVRTFAGDR
jgi:NAD(P)H dehydrogenase (quinone)